MSQKRQLTDRERRLVRVGGIGANTMAVHLDSRTAVRSAWLAACRIGDGERHGGRADIAEPE